MRLTTSTLNSNEFYYVAFQNFISDLKENNFNQNSLLNLC